MLALFDALSDIYADENLTVAATYTPPTGSTVSVRVILGVGDAEWSAGRGVSVSSAQVIATLRAADLGGVEPLEKGRLDLADGTRYRVAAVERVRPAGLEWRLFLE